MAFFEYLPEIVGFLIFNLMAVQGLPVGPLLVAAQLGLAGLWFLVRRVEAAQTFLRWWPLLLTPFIAMASTLWSEVPGVSLRYGVQFIFTAFLGVMLARSLPPRRFMTMLMLALTVFLVLCLLSGRRGASATGMVLIGLTGSKNQIAYIAVVLVMAAVAFLLSGAGPKRLRWVAGAAIPFSAVILLTTNSATAVVSAAGGVAMVVLFALMQRLTPAARIGCFLAVALVAAPLLAIWPEAMAAYNSFLTDTLQKDATLTGRTTLWEWADQLISRKPLLGYGYQAIWLGDSTDSIGLIRTFGIQDPRGFHFHHTYRQFAVDTGLVGMYAFIGVVVAALVAGFAQFIRRPSVATSLFFSIFLLMVARSTIDVIIGPFSIHTVLFYACCVYAFWRPGGETGARR